MRVLYVLNTSNPTNGATKAFMNMLRGVMALGVTPYVVMPDSGGIVGELAFRQSENSPLATILLSLFVIDIIFFSATV